MIASVSGPSGVVKWGYRTVATLGAWRYEHGQTVGTITAQIQGSDAFGLSQDPLVVSVPVGRSVWKWPVLELRRDGPTAVISVGAMEE